MKRATIAMLMAAAIMTSCSKGSNTPVTPVEEQVKFTKYFSQWGTKTLVLSGKDTVIGGYPNKITSIGLYAKDSLYGRFVYRGDTFKISVTDPMDVPVNNSAANNYSLTGWYNKVEFHKSNGTSWSGTLGVYSYKYGRSFYQLDVLTSTNYFISKSYTDSL